MGRFKGSFCAFVLKIFLSAAVRCFLQKRVFFFCFLSLPLSHQTFFKIVRTNPRRYLPRLPPQTQVMVLCRSFRQSDWRRIGFPISRPRAAEISLFLRILGRAGKDPICSKKTPRRRGPPAALSVSASPRIISSPRRVFEKGQASVRRKTKRPGFAEVWRLLGSESSELCLQTD